MATDGNDVRYVRINGDITSLARCFFEFERENLFKKVFWYLPENYMENLSNFYGFFQDLSPCSIYRVFNESETMAYFFIDDHIIPCHCRIGCAVLRKHWGEFAENFAKTLLPEVHEKLKIQRVYAFTPFKTAVSLCERIGMKRAGLIKQYAGGMDVYVYVHE